MTDVRVRYCSIEFPDFDLHVRSLWDDQQCPDDDPHAQGISSANWSLFGVLWPAGRVLARLMAAREVEGLRILEVGCGLGLSSLVLNRRGADITATDHNPAARGFLDANTALNEDPDIPFVRASWTEPAEALGQFDLIIGADILYDRHEIEHLAGFMARLCRVGGHVVLIDPGRKLHARFSKRMVDQGFAHSQRRTAPDDAGDEGVHVLSYLRER